MYIYIYIYVPTPARKQRSPCVLERQLSTLPRSMGEQVCLFWALALPPPHGRYVRHFGYIESKQPKKRNHSVCVCIYGDEGGEKAWMEGEMVLRAATLAHNQDRALFETDFLATDEIGLCVFMYGVGRARARAAYAWSEDILVGGRRIWLLIYSFDVYAARQQT